MRTIGTRWLGVWLAAAMATSGLGCATVTGSASKEDSRKAASHVQVGGDHMANGRSALALREFLAAEQLDPKNAQVHYALADAYLARGKRAESEKHVRRALELFPDYHDARLFLTALLLVEQRYADAIPECNRLIDDPTFEAPWRALTNRAWAEYKLGRSKEARDSLAQAREFRNNYWPATLALAIFEGDAGHRAEAIRLYNDIIAQAPGPSVEAEVNFRIAEIYVALGKRKEAMGHLSTSVARAPESQWGKKSQAYLKQLH